MSWALGDELQTHLVKLPEEKFLSKKVRILTGITEEDLETALSEEEVFWKFHRVVSGQQNPLVVIHYAQFEKSFLLDLYQKYLGVTELPFEIVCTYQVAKKTLPNLPTLTIQGLSGFFGSPLNDLKRSEQYVKATERIWQGLLIELQKKDILGLSELRELLGLKSKSSKKKYEYPLVKEKRLELPNLPGVYRMVAKSGEILYVGKATSLKDRVNSYFRGQKGRDRRKLEMLIQVWDIQVTVCENPVMAAVLENDEIKRLNPKYNISLKTGHRKLVFYDHEFKDRSNIQDAVHSMGPFRTASAIEQLRSLYFSLGSNHFDRIFYEPIDHTLQKEGFFHHCQEENLGPGTILSVRSMLAHGLVLLRRQLLEEDLEEVEDLEDVELTKEAVAEKYGRLFMRASKDYLRTKRTNALINAKVRWEGKDRTYEVFITNGKISNAEDRWTSEAHPWNRLSITDYDRLMIIQSEINKYTHQIELL